MNERIRHLALRLAACPASMAAIARVRVWPFMVMCSAPTPRQVTPEELLGPLNDVEGRFAPAILHISGSLDTLAAGPRIAVIGTRRPTAAGLERAGHWSRCLVETARGVIVSGLAEGIDTAAHVSAIAAGGRTIAVLGTPLDRAYPAGNRDLQARIARAHLAVSQFPSGTRTRPEHFVLRNRTMALISHASIIIEAGESSGTQHQGWEMIRLGRPVWLDPLVADDPALAWPKKLLAHGARRLDELEAVLDDLPQIDRPSGLSAPF
jgi:DNA processing protein